MRLFNNILLFFLNYFCRTLRGGQYKLDKSLPPTTLLNIAARRGLGLVRGVFHGYSPRKLLFIEKNVVIRCRSKLTLGKGVSLGECVLIDALSMNGVVIGDRVSLGPFTRLEASGTITSIGKGVRIGANTGIGGFSFIGGAGGVSIGSDVIMGQWVSFHPENHCFDDVNIPIRLQGVSRKGIVVEDDCWVGAKVTFLDGAHVGRGCVIAAGAVVRGEIPPFSIVGGVPAKVIKRRMH